MAKEYRYSLEQRGKLHICVSCCKKRMTRYVDKETNAYLPERYGRCARLNNCAYHLNPYQDGYGKEEKLVEKKPKVKQALCYVPIEVLKHTFKGYDENVFINNLPFEEIDWKKLVNLYRLGTIVGGEFKGAVTIPYIDFFYNIRTIQVKQFDNNQGFVRGTYLHQIHQHYYKEQNIIVPSWVSKVQSNEENESCFFGEHLLKQFPSNPVALVEDVRTAIYATFYFGLPHKEDDLLFLVEENLSSLNYEKCKVLEGRTITLFPKLSSDKRYVQQWEKRATTFEQNIKSSKFIVSDFLEEKANEQDRLDACGLYELLVKLKV
jgi:hypothetical protein